jgi:hypothetical protein
MINLWLDDVRPAPEGWVWVKTVKDAKAVIRENRIDALSLDHDLGGDNPTGYDLVKWLEEEVIVFGRVPPRTMTIHSANPPGRRNMMAGIESIRKNAVIV